MFLRRLSNGSDSVIRLYELLMVSKCRIVMLTGSLIGSSPFELAPAFNMLSGEVIFPEVEADFEKYFIDIENNKMKNKAIFQNRIYGLVSRMKLDYLSDEDKKLFPTLYPIEVVRIKMDDDQFNSYSIARLDELKRGANSKFVVNSLYNFLAGNSY